MKATEKLLLERIIELGTVAYEIHQDLMRWRDPPMDLTEKTCLSVKLQSALEKQRTIADALMGDDD